jgi:hypothetical protein
MESLLVPSCSEYRKTFVAGESSSVPPFDELDAVAVSEVGA